MTTDEKGPPDGGDSMQQSSILYQTIPSYSSSNGSINQSISTDRSISIPTLSTINETNTAAKKRNKFLAVITSISVEPVTLLFIAAFACVNSCGTSAIYNKVCHQKFPQLDCFNLDKKHSVIVQEEATNWNMYIAIAEVILTCPATLLWSAYGDYSGRKINMMVAISGYAIYAFVYACAAAFDRFPLWLMPVLILFTGSTGLMPLLFNACIQYLGDTIEDKETMTVRMAIVLAFTTIGGIIGGLIGSNLLRITNNNFALAILVAQLFLIVAQMYVVVFLKQIPPVELSEEVVTLNDNKIPKNANKTIAPKLDLIGIKRVLSDIWTTFTKPRPNNNRTYIIVLLLSFILFATDLGGANKIKNLFAFQKPLTFSPSQYGMLGVVSGIETFTANILISGIGKKVLHMRDTTLMLISFGSASAAMIVLGLSKHNWMLWLADIINAPGLVGVAGLQSIFSNLAEDNERGKLVAGTAIVQAISKLISNVMYPQIYSATVAHYAGTVFFVISGVVLVGFSMVLWVHIKMKQRSTSLKEII